MVYFKSETEFKLFKTFSINHLTDDKLTESSCIEFADHINTSDDRYGVWFKSLEDLEEYNKHNQQDIVQDTKKYGLNAHQGIEVGDADDESDYIDMVNNLEI